jgi:hypothetical protein
MAKQWGRTPITNADQRHATQMTYMVGSGEETEERIDRRPMGKVERFVDKDGNVCSLKLFDAGDSKRLETEQRNRAGYHRKGFIEHAKCPIRSGTRNSSEITARDFAKMPASMAAECKHEIRVMRKLDGVLYAEQGCPHIEWLIKERVKKAAADYKKRNAQVAAADERAAAKAQAEIDQSKALALLLEERRQQPARRNKEPVE